MVEMTDKRKGGRRWRSDSRLENEKERKSSGEVLHNILLLGLQSFLHSLSMTVRMLTLTSCRSSSCFTIELAAAFHFLLLIWFTIKASSDLHTFPLGHLAMAWNSKKNKYAKCIYWSCNNLHYILSQFTATLTVLCDIWSVELCSISWIRLLVLQYTSKVINTVLKLSSIVGYVVFRQYMHMHVDCEVCFS